MFQASSNLFSKLSVKHVMCMLMSLLDASVAVTSFENPLRFTYDSECGKQFSSTVVISWVLSVVLLWTVIYRLYRKFVSVS
jgi:hypothetical protein